MSEGSKKKFGQWQCKFRVGKTKIGVTLLLRIGRLELFAVLAVASAAFVAHFLASVACVTLDENRALTTFYSTSCIVHQHQHALRHRQKHNLLGGGKN